MPYGLAFDRPAYLLLLGLAPLLAWWGRHSLSALGGRRFAAIALRMIVLAAIVFALADVQFQKKSDALTVVYVLDQSLSIPADQRDAMLDFVRESTGKFRDDARGDRFAVVVFGRDAKVEVPPATFSEAVGRQVESSLDPEETDLAGAIQRATALFPAGAARRIVLVSDGNQNLGDAYRQARAAAAAGVSIDVVPVYLSPRGDASVEKVDVPGSVRRGQPFDLRVVLANDSPADVRDAKRSQKGRLVVVRKAGGSETTISDEPVDLEPGKQVFTLQQELADPDFYEYEARFIPDDLAADATSQNNAATGFTSIRGRGQTLLVENADNRGETDELARRLREQDIAVSQTTSDQPFASLADLQRYDAVVLANVSRTSDSDSEGAAMIGDEQVEMLVRNTRELGCGLVMLGGPDSFGAGGWANTKLEEAMPVDFQIKAAKVVPVGALALVIDRSGSMDGEKLAMSRAAGVAAVRAMGARDYVTVIAFDSVSEKTVPLRRVGDARFVSQRINGLASAGGTDMFPAMQMGFAELRKATEAAVRHMIVLTDGQTPEAAFGRLVAQMRAQNITVTSVAVGADANTQLLADIARGGGGKFYAVRNPRTLPRIFLREVRRVSRPLVFETPDPMSPIVEAPDHEILRGVEGGVPPITGYVLTTLKENPLVERLLRAPLPEKQENATLLAAWTYGAGKSVAFTTDFGRRWAAGWPEWDGYDKFFAQMIRWAMRPTGGSGNFTVASDVRSGVAQLAITALDAKDQFLNNLPMTAIAISPDLKTIPVAVRQTAPGRYVGDFPATQAGSYLVVVNPGNGTAPIRTGVNVGYSAEYRDRQTNVPLLESIAELQAKAGLPGEFAKDGLAAIVAGDKQPNRGAAAAASEQPNPFRRDLPRAVSQQSIWPWFVVAATCLFWSDVFIRRVQIELGWLLIPFRRIAALFSRRQEATATPATIDRLRSRKREVGEQIDARRGATRFEASAVESAVELRPVDSAAAPAVRPAKPQPPTAAPAAAEPESYTERLLDAKRRARRDRGE